MPTLDELQQQAEDAERAADAARSSGAANANDLARAASAAWRRAGIAAWDEKDYCAAAAAFNRSAFLLDSVASALRATDPAEAISLRREVVHLLSLCALMRRLCAEEALDNGDDDGAMTEYENEANAYESIATYEKVIERYYREKLKAAKTDADKRVFEDQAERAAKRRAQAKKDEERARKRAKDLAEKNKEKK